MKNLYILTIISIISITGYLQAQDATFSQYQQAGTFYNPAMTAVMESQHRLTIMYRNQWYSVLNEDAYHQGFLAYEGKVLCTQTGFFALGSYAFAGRAGDVPISNYQYQAALAYHHLLGNQLVLAGGFKAGLLHYRLETDDLQFDEQFGLNGFDGSLNSFEDINNWNTSQFKFDLGFGIALYDTEGRFSGGFSLMHLNQPFYSFFPEGDENKIGTGIIIHGSGKVQENLYLRGFYQRQAFFGNSRQWQTLLGIYAPFSLGRNKYQSQSISFGLSTRLSGKNPNGVLIDAVIPAVFYDLGNWAINLSYDINTSSLAQASWLNGGIELGLQIKFGEAGACIRCPKFW